MVLYAKRFESDEEPRGSVGPELAALLVALYLRGAPRGLAPDRRNWPAVLSAIRRFEARLESAPDALRRSGLCQEAAALETDGLADWAWARVRERAAITAACSAYPPRWLKSLGAGAPPALWMRGAWPSGPMIAVVGARSPSAEAKRFATRIGAEAARLGYAVVSGGACGVDRLAVRAALEAGGEVLEILPCGLGVRGRGHGCARGSVCAPSEEFSAATAMERNALVYAAAEAAVIVESGFKEGGTWHGALGAARRRLCPLIVRDAPEREGHRALCALGAIPIRRASDLAGCLRLEGANRSLFGTFG